MNRALGIGLAITLVGAGVYAARHTPSTDEGRRAAAMDYLDGRRLAAIPVEVCTTRERLLVLPVGEQRARLADRIRSLKTEWKLVRRRQHLREQEALPRCDEVSPALAADRGN